jgi:hypothetical protein
MNLRVTELIYIINKLPKPERPGMLHHVVLPIDITVNHNTSPIPSKKEIKCKDLVFVSIRSIDGYVWALEL